MKHTKESLRNTKIRVPTPAISEKVQRKLFEIGSEWVDSGKEILYKEDSNIFIDNEGFMQRSTMMEVKEIPYTEIIDEEESPEFKSWKELHDWRNTGKPYFFLNLKYVSDCDTYYANGEDLTDYSKFIDPPKPKEIVLYRYTYIDGGNICQSIWSDEKTNVPKDILKTETKAVKLEE